MLNIEITTYGEKTLSNMLEGVSGRCRDLRPFFEKTGSRIVLRSTAANIKAGGRPPWRKLARSTMVQRAVLGYGAAAPMLVRTGRLLRSVSKKGDPNNVIRIDKLEMQIYSKLQVGRGHYLAEIHQKGSSHTRPAISGPLMHFFTGTGEEVFTRKVKAATINIPARKIYALQEAENRRIVFGMRRHILASATEEGLI